MFFVFILACPVIWGRRYRCLSYSSMLPCVSCCPLSAPLLSCLSCMHLSTLGLVALYFFSPVCPHLTVFSLCAPFHHHHMAVPLQSFSVIVRVSQEWSIFLHHSCCPSNVFISGLIPPCHSAPTPQHHHPHFYKTFYLVKL